MEMLLTTVLPEVEALREYPRLDPRGAARVFKKLKICAVPELTGEFEAGSIGKICGARTLNTLPWSEVRRALKR